MFLGVISIFFIRCFNILIGFEIPILAIKRNRCVSRQRLILGLIDFLIYNDLRNTHPYKLARPNQPKYLLDDVDSIENVLYQKGSCLHMFF